jgi:mannosyl-oligosaccharide alpha-1,2-mannosidase
MLLMKGMFAAKARTDEKYLHVLPDDAHPVGHESLEKIVMQYPLFENETHYPSRWLAQHTRDELDASRAQALLWAEEAKEAARHSWRGYQMKAWGHDQIHTESGEPSTWFGLGLNIVEGLDTLWLLGLYKEFDEASEWVERYLSFSDAPTKMDSFFEATIRLLGGLLGAHSLSQRPIFLTRARELGDRLISAWPPDADLPNAEVDIAANKSQHTKWRQNTFGTAEVGSCQLEFRYLSYHTGDPTYAIFADKAFSAILAATPNKGLVSNQLIGNTAPKEYGSTITMGAHGDSFYEYLLKQYLQTSQTEPLFLHRWKRAMEEMMERLLQESDEGNVYIAKLHDGSDGP